MSITPHTEQLLREIIRDESRKIQDETIDRLSGAIDLLVSLLPPVMTLKRCSEVTGFSSRQIKTMEERGEVELFRPFGSRNYKIKRSEVVKLLKPGR